MRQGSNINNKHAVTYSSDDKRDVQEIRQDYAQQQQVQEQAPVQEQPQVQSTSTAPAPAPTTQTTPTTAPTTGSTTGTTVVQEGAEQPSRIWDAHYSPQWVLDEQQKRLNPEYVSELSDDVIDPNTFDMLANYVAEKKKVNEKEWRYGDPGWSSDDPAWVIAFEPLEQAYQQKQRQAQIVAPQQETNDAIAKVDAKYKNLQVDKSDADYNKEQFDEKLITLFTPGSSGSDIENAPAAAKYTQGLIGSYVSSSGPARMVKYAAAAAGIPYVGWIAGATHFALFAYNYEKQRGNIKGNKVVDKILELTDIMDTKSQQFQGALAYAAEKIGIDDLSNTQDFFVNAKTIVDNIGDFAHYAFGSGRASTEFDPDVVGMVTEKTANMGATPFIGNIGSRAARSALSWIDMEGYWLDRNEVSRNNLGLSGTYELPEELVGSNAITTWMSYVQDLKNELLPLGYTMDDVEFLFNQKFTEVYGDMANLSEFIEHEWTDPGNTLENVESRATGLYAKATHDVNLQKAAESQYGSTMGTLTGNMKILPNVVREIGKLTGHDWWKTPGDLDQVLKAWDAQNLVSTPEELTARDRRFSGINEDNTVDRFDPNKKPSDTTNLIGKAVQGVKNFFSETNESRAMEEGDAIFDVIKVGVASALERREGDGPESATNRVIDFLASLENPESIPETSPFYETSQSVLFNTVKDDLAQAVRSRRTEINKIIQAYQETEDNRFILNTLAESLNMTPQKLLNMYENQKTVLTQMIINKARANGGTIPNITFEDGTPIDVEGRAFGEKVMQMIRPFTGDDFVAWNPQQLVVQLSTDIADGVSSTIINKFNIEPDKFIYRLGNTVKTMQNLVLLGLSPSYLANNFINNIVTRTALGYGGWMSIATISNWMDRFGYHPDRETESFGPEIGQKSGAKQNSSYEKLRMSIRDKKRMKDGLDKISNFSSKASEKFGLFGNLSSKIESLESQQILAAAMMHYMNQTWKPGVNFRKMPIGLEAEIDRQMPGMSKAIYSAISKGINMEEIEDALFGSFVAPSVHDSLVEAARRKGNGDPEGIVTEYFVRSGMLNMMEQALRGKRGDEIQPIIDDFAKELQAMMEVQFSDVIATQAEDIKNKVGWEGYVEAIKSANDASEEMAKVWLASNDSNSRVFQRRVEEGMSTKEFRKLYQQHQQYLTERWKNVYAKMRQTYDGILTGLGIGDKNRETYLQLLNEKNNLWVDFYETIQPETIKPYLDSLKFKPGEKRTEWNSRVSKAWADYQEAINKKVADIRDKDLRLQERMDKAYMTGLKQVMGTAKSAEIESVLAPKFEAIRNKRKEISEHVNAIRENAKKVQMFSQKNDEWDIGNPMRVELTKDLENLQKDLYNAIAEMNPFVQGKPAKDPTNPPDPTVHITAEVNHEKAQQEQKVAEKYSEKATNNIAKSKVKKDKTISILKGQITRTQKTYAKNFNRLQEIQELKKTAVQNRDNATIDSLMKEYDKVNSRLHKSWDRLTHLREELNLRESEMKAMTPDQMKFELRKDNLRDVFKQVGYSTEQADVTATVIEARATNWELKHPGHDYYKEQYHVLMEYLDVDKFVNKNGNVMNQVSKIPVPLKNAEDAFKDIIAAIPPQMTKVLDDISYSDLITLVDNFEAVLSDVQDTFGLDLFGEDGKTPYFKSRMDYVLDNIRKEVGDEVFEEIKDYNDDYDEPVPYASTAKYYANNLISLMSSLQQMMEAVKDNEIDTQKVYDLFGVGDDVLSADEQDALAWASMQEDPNIDFKPDVLTPVDTTTPESQEFLGNHPKMRTADNKPIVVYNTGRNPDIRHFDKGKRGKGAGGADTSQVWYFNQSSIASGSYADGYDFSENNKNYKSGLKLLQDSIERESFNYYDDALNSFLKGEVTQDYLTKILGEYKDAIEALPIDGGHKANINHQFFENMEELMVAIDSKNASKRYIRDLATNVVSTYRAVTGSDAILQIANNQYKDIWDFDNWFTKPYYLSIKNPLVVDFQGHKWDQGLLNPHIMQALREGRDGIIIENIIDGGGIVSTDYLVFDNNQIKSYYNTGPMSMKTDNVYLQTEQPVTISDVNGQEHKVQTISRADTNTRAFKKWHGNHPLNQNPDGSPLSVWHASEAVFNSFNKELLGSNTGSPSAKMGIFFSGNKKTALSYILQEQDKDTYIKGKLFSEVYPFVSVTPYSDVYDIDTIRNTLAYAEDILQRSSQAFPELSELQERSTLYKYYKQLADTVSSYSTDDSTSIYNFAHLSSLLRGAIDKTEEAINNEENIRKDLDIIQDVPDPSVNVREFYLSFNNPFVYDFGGADFRDVSYANIIQQAIEGGYDAVILQNTYDGGPLDTIYVVFESNQMKSVYNSGEWSDPKNIYHQAAQRIKGDFKVEDAMNIVKLFRGNDLSTLVHELLGHGFAQTLDDDEVEALAQYNGWTVDEYRRLEDLWNHNKQMTAAERQAWIDAQEKFAYGFEDYLLQGKAPNSAMAQVFETFKNYLIEIYKGLKHVIYNGEEIDIDKEQNGVTLRQIFDRLLEDYDPEKIKEESRKKIQAQIEARKPQSEQAFANGQFAPLSDIDITTIDKTKGDREQDVKLLAIDLYNKFKDEVVPAVSTTPTLQDWIKYIKGTAEDGQPMLSSRQMEDMDFRIKSLDDTSVMNHINALRNNIVNPNAIPEQGAYIVPTYAFSSGKYEKIVAAVTDNGKIVAYVPSEMPLTEVQNGKETYRVVGVSSDDPELFVYVVDNEIRTQKRHEDNGNPYYPELQQNSLGTTDPVAEAYNELGYEELLPILQEFGDVYRQNLDKNMTNYKFSGLDKNTRSMLRGYIDHDIRSDMLNTKYKTGKFGEMMRDAALLNYNKRYGFDNFLTALFPYQFWLTRSFKNWLGRMDGKGSKMWRKYYKWKELEKRNKKEFMPSKITGKWGIPVYGMDDWLGDGFYMSTDQMFIVNQFADPILNYGKKKNAVIAAAEKYVQEAFDNGDIDYPTYLSAINPETREDVGAWQEALAKAELEDTSDKSFGGLVGEYLGLNLPLSVSKALLTGDVTEWNQWPMTRTGTAFRATVGNNWVGKLGERVLSAPERALRKAAVDEFGNAFEYNEFGSFGDYYMRNMVFDMVTEGRIEASDAVQACAEKDGNPIWEEAAERVRKETLIKMQGGAVVDAGKKLVKDIADGNNDSIRGDLMYLFAAFITAPFSKNVVHAAEPVWRKEKAGLSEAYAEGTQNEYYDEHPGVSYVNLRYESDTEKMLRQYLYKQINEKYYALDPADRRQIDISFDPDFKKYVIDKDTRAIEAIDINKLAAYAQALNGKVPFFATDKLNTMNIPQLPIAQVPQTTKDHYNEYMKIRDEQYPGMAMANKIYYELPAEDRKIFSRANPNLKPYQDWDKKYKNEHADVKQYSALISDSYDIAEMENACALLDATTMKYLKIAAYGDGKLGAEFKPVIEAVMAQVGSTDKYDYFIKNLMKYIRSE